MKIHIIASLFIGSLLFSCTAKQVENVEAEPTQTFMNKGHELVYNMVQKVGDYETLKSKKNVSYIYSYQTPNGQKDVANEKYIFDGELSYGAYYEHERTFPQLEGAFEQGYDGQQFWLRYQGEFLEEEDLLKRVAFNRPTNFYWFTMMQKLLDQGLVYEHLGQDSIAGKRYDVVKITFESNNEKPTDIYQLYINSSTQLVDQFLFTVADFGKMETPFLMQLEYENIDGMLIPSKRQYKASTWDAAVSEEPWIKVSWTDIQFNTNITPTLFHKSTSLTSQLEAKKIRITMKPETDKKRIYREGIAAVASSGILEKAMQVGDVAPNFSLPNASGETVELYDYLKKGKVVLTWYRGGWCPYCNLALHELQKELVNFKANGAQLLALTPEMPDKSMTTSEKHNLEFEILSDVGNKVGKEYGVVFKLTDDVANIYNEAFALNEYNGNESNELPLAATYIINEKGVITYAFLDADYRNRAEPLELTQQLKSN
jgi:peroxiredoxin